MCHASIFNHFIQTTISPTCMVRFCSNLAQAQYTMAYTCSSLYFVIWSKISDRWTDSHFSCTPDDPWTLWVPVVTAVDEKNHFKKIKMIAPANYTTEVVCIDQILPKSAWLNRKLIFLIIFFVARFERDLILHTADEWWVRWP